MIWAGAVILVLGIGFFLKYAFENAWIGPTGRVAMGVLSGLAMLVTGDAARRRDYRFLGQGLTGGGIAALYVSVYAASGFYQLIPREPAFLLMLAVTACGITLAVLQDAIAVAILAILGGLGTPVLFSTGQDKAEVLFAYLAVLDLGVLGAAFYRRWRALDLLAYAGTLILYGGWFTSFYRPERMTVALAGLLGFFGLFILIPVVPALRRRALSPPEAVLLPAVSGVATFVFAYRILFDQHKTALAFLTLLLSAGYVAMGTLVKRAIPADRGLVSGHLILAVAFLTLAIPIQLGLYGITLAWAVEGAVLILLGFRTREPLVRLGGLAALGFAAVRIFTHHQPLHHELFRPLLNRPFGTVFLVAAAFFASGWIWKRHREEADAAPLASALAVLGGALVVFLASAETDTYCRLAGEALRQVETYQAASHAILLILWGAAAVIFVGVGLGAGDSLSRVAGAAIFLVAGLQAASRFGSVWVLFGGSHADGAGALFLNRSFLSALFVVACLAVAAAIYRKNPPRDEAWDSAMPWLLSAAAIAELWFLLTAEVYRFFSAQAPGGQEWERSGWRAQMAVTVTWTLYAVALLAAGFLRSRPALRYTAFALLGAAVLKALLVDMAEVRQIYRVVSLLALGLVLVGVSYLYSRAARRPREGRPGS